jgi:hypothetical protein
MIEHRKINDVNEDIEEVEREIEMTKDRIKKPNGLSKSFYKFVLKEKNKELEYLKREKNL